MMKAATATAPKEGGVKGKAAVAKPKRPAAAAAAAAAAKAGGKKKGGVGGSAAAAKAANKTKFVIELAQPVEDRVLDSEGLKNFLSRKLKVDGKTQNLKDRVQITNDRTKVYVVVEIPFSKRYLKYLTKKYLKGQQLRDFLRVIANRDNSYELRYFQMSQEQNEEK